MAAKNALAGADAIGAGHRQRQSWSVLTLLCAAQFMVILDMTVVTVALPSIGRSPGIRR